MATPKKSSVRKGLQFPSRKQRDWEQEKTGDLILFEERRLSTTSGDIVSSGNSSLIYTCPADKRAKISYAALSTKTGEGYIELQIKTGPTFLLHTYTPNTLNYNAAYNDGIDLEPGDTVTIVCGVAAGNVAVGTLQTIEDDVSPGYLLPQS